MRYGDAEPEDAWVPSDPVAVLLDNLTRRTRQLGARPYVQPATDLAAYAKLAAVVETLQRVRASPERVAMLADDLAHVARRLNIPPVPDDG